MKRIAAFLVHRSALYDEIEEGQERERVLRCELALARAERDEARLLLMDREVSE